MIASKYIRNRRYIQPEALTGLIPILLLPGLLSQVVFLFSNASALLVTAACLVVYIVSLLLAGGLDRGLWAGYLLFTVTTIWLILGITAALVIVVAGSFLSLAIQYTVKNRYWEAPETFISGLNETLKRIAISGNSALIAFGVYMLADGMLPVSHLLTANMLPLTVMLVSSFITTIIIGSLLTKQNPFKQHVVQERNRLAMELLMLTVPVLASTVYYQINAIGFLLMMILSVAQVSRYSAVYFTQTNLKKRVHELSILNRVGQSLSANIDMDDVMMSIYREVSLIVGAPVFFIALYDDNNQRVDYRLVIENDERTTWHSRTVSGHLTDYVLKSKTMLLIHRSETERLEQLGINTRNMASDAYLGIPLMIGNKPLGVMGLLNFEKPATLSPESLNILHTIANQASLIIRNATLYDRTTTLARNLSLINQSIQHVTLNLDNQEAMSLACDTARQITNARQTAIYLFDVFEEDKATLLKTVGPDSPLLSKNVTVPFARTRLETVNHIIGNGTSIGEPFEGHNYQTSAIIALRSGTSLLGYLSLYHDRAYQYNTTELNLLETLANQIIAAHDNAELMHALESYATEQAQLVSLSGISTVSLELDKVITAVCEILGYMLTVNVVQIGLLVPGKQQLSLYKPLPNKKLGQTTLTQDKLKAFTEFQTSMTQLAYEPKIYYRSSGKISSVLDGLMHDTNAETTAIVPMITNNDFMGIILLADTAHRNYNESEQRLIEMATHQISTQIHNAQIYTLTEEALVQRLHQLSSIEDIAQQISRTLDMDVIIQNVLEAATRTTQADTARLILIDSRKYLVYEQNTRGNHAVRTTTLDTLHTEVTEKSVRQGLILIKKQDAQEALDDNPTEPYNSMIAVPLMQDEKTIGILVVKSCKQDFFSEEHTSFIKSLAGHATISISNARLLENSRKEIETLSNLRELSLQVATANGKKAVSNALLETSLKLLKARSSALFAYADDVDEVTLLGSMAAHNGQFYMARTLIPETIARDAIKTGKKQIIGNIHESSHYKDYTNLDAAPYRSVVAVPIRRGASVTEVLCLTFEEIDQLQNERLNSTLDLLSIQAGGHLENALLNERLITNNNQMNAILNSTRDGIILLDRSMSLVDANLAAEHLLGIDLNERKGENFAQVIFEATGNTTIGHEEELLNMARILRSEPQRITSREYILINQKEPIYIKEVGSPVLDSNGNITGRLLSLHDITEEQKLASYRDRIRRMVFHDLRSPLSTIISGLTLAPELLSEMESENDYLSIILEGSLDSAKHLLELVNTLLDIPKLQEGKMEPKRETTSLMSIVEHAHNTLALSLEKAEIEFVYQIAADLPELFIDKDLIRRTLINLIDNAMRYTPKGGQVMISGAISVENPDFVRVMVCDTGPGIPPDKQELIFREFEQIEGRRPERGSKGSGLGLTFCKLAVQAHGGQIWVEATGPLSGACFAFLLPIEKLGEPALEIS